MSAVTARPRRVAGMAAEEVELEAEGRRSRACSISLSLSLSLSSLIPCTCCSTSSSSPRPSPPLSPGSTFGCFGSLFLHCCCSCCCIAWLVRAPFSPVCCAAPLLLEMGSDAAHVRMCILRYRFLRNTRLHVLHVTSVSGFSQPTMASMFWTHFCSCALHLLAFLKVSPHCSLHSYTLFGFLCVHACFARC